MNTFRNFILHGHATCSTNLHSHVSRKIVILKPHSPPIQGVLETVLKNYSRIRDYYLPPSTNFAHVYASGIHFYPYLIIVNSIADAVNATLLEENQLCEQTDHCDLSGINSYPKILTEVPVVEERAIYNGALFSIWEKYYVATR